jgi:hypothetical protein
LPITFGTTTTGKKMNITLTRQTCFFDDSAAQGILESFVKRLETVAPTQSPFG